MSEKPGDLSVNVNVNLPAVQGDDEAPYSNGLGYGLWCAGLVGACGIHRSYLGKIGTGVLGLVTFGLLGVGQLVDLFRILNGMADRGTWMWTTRRAPASSSIGFRSGNPELIQA